MLRQALQSAQAVANQFAIDRKALKDLDGKALFPANSDKHFASSAFTNKWAVLVILDGLEAHTRSTSQAVGHGHTGEEKR